jgi:hypothetical protein
MPANAGIHARHKAGRYFLSSQAKQSLVTSACCGREIAASGFALLAMTNQ